MRRIRSAHPSSAVVTMPPSPVVMTLRGWNENATSPPLPPIGVPRCSAPSAHAASSTTSMPRGSQSAWMASRSAGTPAWCTTSTARVAGVSTASMVLAVRLSVVASTSANTGIAPTARGALAVAMYDSDGTTTSSSGPRSSTESASCNAAVPDDAATPWAAPTRAASTCSNSAVRGPCATQPDATTSARARASSVSSHGFMTGMADPCGVRPGCTLHCAAPRVTVEWCRRLLGRKTAGMFTVGRNFHVIHMTDDLAALDAWYVDVFGMQRYVIENYSPELHRHASLGVIGELCIEPMQPAFDDDRWNRGPIGRYYERSGISWHSIAWYVNDVEGLTELRDGLEAADVELLALLGGKLEHDADAPEDRPIFTHPNSTVTQLEFMVPHPLIPDVRMHPAFTPAS